MLLFTQRIFNLQQLGSAINFFLQFSVIYLNIITCFFIFVSCKSNVDNTSIKSVVGEWELDSVSGNVLKWTRNFVFITDKGRLYEFSDYRGKRLVDSISYISGSSIFKNNKKIYGLQLLDSMNFMLRDNFGNEFFYHNYDKQYQADTKKDLNDFIITDSIFKSVIGCWKLKTATFRPIDMPNYPNDLDDFTLVLQKSGRAKVYMDNSKDSITDYSWQAEPFGISFGRYDVVGMKSPIYYLNKNKMVLALDKWQTDTLTFERCSSVTKN